MTDTGEAPLRYRDAGVDLDRGRRLVDRIRPIAERTRGPGVLAGVGGFASVFALPADRYRNPVLVTAADGVGTKLALAVRTGIYDTVGIDLVAMCANDVLAHGAEPALFLDYLAMGRLDTAIARTLVEGIAVGCERAGAALAGGESAEMPGTYTGRNFDLAGFCLGLAERDRIVDGARIRPGDLAVGLASSGVHSNGFSLVRKVLEVSGASLEAPFEDGRGESLGRRLMTPTRIYARAVRALVEAVPVRGLAHVTGGGLAANPGRVLPDGLRVRLDRARWTIPPIIRWVRETGGIEEGEMFRTFNCGVGMVAYVSPEHAGEALRVLREAGEAPAVIGEVTRLGRGRRARVAID